MNRKYNVPIDFTAYSTWHSQHIAQSPIGNDNPPHPPSDCQVSTAPASQSPTSTAVSDKQAAPYPLSFNHVVDLITSGEPIPGIKEVPDTVLEGQASNTTKLARKKPWEKSNDDESINLANVVVAGSQDR